MGERFVIERDGCDLAGERWPGNAQLVVLLHEGGRRPARLARGGPAPGAGGDGSGL
jgi:hypothetical protein